MLPIKGIQKTSLIDYPDRISTIIFLSGCNFRCPYCQNPDLIKNPDKFPTIKEDKLINFLEKRKKWVDAIVVTGGEPLLYNLMPFLKKLKEKGFFIKLDTNGSNPKQLKEIISKELVDYIAMDVKAPLENYNKVAGVKVDLASIKQSINLIINSGIDYEFRMTVLTKLHSEEDILKTAKQLKGAKKFYLQQFSPKVTLDSSFKKAKPFKKEEIERIKEKIRGNFKICEVRY